MTIERLPSSASGTAPGLGEPASRPGAAAGDDARAAGPWAASGRAAWADVTADDRAEPHESSDDDDASDDPPWAQLWPIPAEESPARRVTLALAPIGTAAGTSFAARVVALHHQELGGGAEGSARDRQLHAVHDRRLMLAVGRLALILLVACLGAAVSFYAAYVNT